MSRSLSRISASELTDMWEQHLLPQRPVVVTGLFDGQPLAEVTTLSAAREVLGHMPVTVQEEYSKRLRSLSRPGSADPPEDTDGLYMPPLTWHYVEYEDAGMSFNLRFGRNAYNRFFSADNLLPDHRLQRIASPFAGIPPGEDPPEELDAVLREILGAFNDDHESLLDRHRAVRDVTRGLYDRLPDRPPPLFLFDSDEITEFYAERRMRAKAADGPLTKAVIHREDDRPLPAARAEELRRLTATGYPDDLLTVVLRNLFGTERLTDLNGSAAKRLLTFVNSRSGRPLRPAA